MRASTGLSRWTVLATIAVGLVATHCNKRLDEGSEAAAMTSASPAPSGTCTSTEYAKCESPAVQTVLKWFSATTPGEKAAMLYRPDANKTEFLDHTGMVFPKQVTVNMDGCGSRPMDGACQVLLDKNEEDLGFVWLRITPNGACDACGAYRVDWKGTYVVNPMAMAAFQASMPTQPVVWRANAKLDTYFNYEFLGQQASYYSFRVSDPRAPQKRLWTYAKKGTPDAEAMFQALSDGKESEVTVSIAYPTSRRSNEITKLVAYYGQGYLQTSREIDDARKVDAGAR